MQTQAKKQDREVVLVEALKSLYVGGFDLVSPPFHHLANAETYNGSSWSEGPDQPGTMNRSGVGHYTSFVTAGGSVGTSGAPSNLRL